jgi:ADP-heptose:LPS heptosyltransferase
MTKILLLRFSSIGDIVLTTPVVRAIKQQVQHAEVHYCTKSGFRTLLEANPYVDKIHCLGDSLSELIRQLQQEKFDYVIDLHHNLRTRIIKLRLGAPSGSFDKLNFEKWLLVNLKINRMPAVHIVDRYLAAAASLGVTDDGRGLDYFIPPAQEVDVCTLPFSVEATGYAAFAIGAQHATKRLPEEKILELCRKISIPVVLMGGKEDGAVGERIEQTLLAEGRQVFNACGKYSLHQSASLVRQSRVVFSHDTGLMHIAAAFQKEIYAIWGNTVPAFGMYPYRTAHHALENVLADCRPCSKIGYSKCPKGHFKCMYGQDFAKLELRF